MKDPKIERNSGRCVKTERVLAEGESYYVVLFEEGESFHRENYSEEAWDGVPDGAYCHFKTRVPIKETSNRKRVFIDDEALVAFFVRLANDEQLIRQQFRFVLALIMMRKRLVKYEETCFEGDQEFWQMRLMKDKSTHKVLNPRLTDEDTERVSEQLGAILHGDMGQFDEAASEEALSEEVENDQDGHDDLETSRVERVK